MKAARHIGLRGSCVGDWSVSGTCSCMWGAFIDARQLLTGLWRVGMRAIPFWFSLQNVNINKNQCVYLEFEAGNTKCIQQKHASMNRAAHKRDLQTITFVQFSSLPVANNLEKNHRLGW